MGRLHIHIGFPKCASTSLQLGVFARHPDIEYLAVAVRGGRGADASVADAAIKALKYNVEDDADEAACRRLAAVSATRQETSACVLLSDEGLVRHADPRALKRFFPEARILVVLRAPVDYFTSMYHQSLKGFGGKYRPLRSIDEFVSERLDAGPNDYERLVGFLEVFDAARFGIVLFETLKTDPHAFVRQIAEALGIDSEAAVRLFDRGHHNPRISNYQLLAKRIRTISPMCADLIAAPVFAPLRSAAKGLLPPASVEQRPSPRVARMVERATAAPLTRIARLTNVPLGDAGYPL